MNETPRPLGARCLAEVLGSGERKALELDERSQPIPETGGGRSFEEFRTRGFCDWLANGLAAERYDRSGLTAGEAP